MNNSVTKRTLLGLAMIVIGIVMVIHFAKKDEDNTVTVPDCVKLCKSFNSLAESSSEAYDLLILYPEGHETFKKDVRAISIAAETASHEIKKHPEYIAYEKESKDTGIRGLLYVLGAMAGLIVILFGAYLSIILPRRSV